MSTGIDSETRAAAEEDARSSATATATVGVLALQGDFAAHLRVLTRLVAHSRPVRRPDQLAGLDALILPGGESSTLLTLMESTGFETALADFHAGGGALLGTCAGAILLAREVVSPDQRSLGLIDITVGRNAYGRQLDSFEADAEWVADDLSGPPGQTPRPLPLVFIRAPKIMRLGPDVIPLARCRGDIVLARQGRVLAATFHPEISGDTRVHRYLLEMVAAWARAGAPCGRKRGGPQAASVVRT
ncbi:MAG: pyridoxal 5'-phosphate synthase glutaminase subunit PdxT [Acidobacteriota bacterium]